MADSSTTEPEQAGQRASQRIAQMLIERGPGARLPTAIELREQLQVGSGTVQRTLRSFESAKAVVVRPRGHLGTFIKTIDVKRLWAAARLSAPHVAMPPVGPREMLGIALALTQEFDAHASLPTFGYYRGAATRVARLDGRADVAVVSSGAVSHLGLDQDGTYFIQRLDQYSYYAPSSLVVLSRHNPPNPRRLRVAVDPSSDDHVRLTAAEFGDCQLVQADFRRLPVAILEDDVDTGVWHRLELLISPEQAGIEVRPIGDRAAALAEEISAACLVARSGTTGAALLRTLNIQRVRDVLSTVSADVDLSEYSGPGASRLP